MSVKFAVGYARVAINDVKKRHFVLLPRVDSISPASGSIRGGTLLTVQVPEVFTKVNALERTHQPDISYRVLGYSQF